MSFTDDENKRIENEENKAQAEFRSKFRNRFSEEELKDSAKEYQKSLPKTNGAVKKSPSVSVQERSGSSRVVKKVNLTSDAAKPKRASKGAAKPAVSSKSAAKPAGSSKNRAAGSKKAAETEKVRIKGPGYSLSGHKILADSNYEDEFRTKEKKAVSRKKEPVRPPVSEIEEPQSYSRPDPVSNERAVLVPGTYRVARGIYAFRQDIIPKASNELTKYAVMNDTRKVRARARRVEKAGEKGTGETVQKAQVSVFSSEFRTEYVTDHSENDSVFAKSGRGAGPRKKRQYTLQSVDNSKKKQRQRLRQNKPKGPGGKIALVILLVLFLAICIFGYIEAQVVFDDSAMDPDDLSKIEYTVTEGTTDEAVAEFLVSHNMVESTLLYKLRAKIFDVNYKPGTYELSPSYSTEKIINILSGFDYSSN